MNLEAQSLQALQAVTLSGNLDKLRDTRDPAPSPAPQETEADSTKPWLSVQLPCDPC